MRYKQSIITSQIVHVLVLVEGKLNNCSTIHHDNAHVRTQHWWLVHIMFLFTTLLPVMMIIPLPVLCLLKIHI